MAIVALLLTRAPKPVRTTLAWMALGLLLTVLFVALSVAAPRTEEGFLREYEPIPFPPEFDLGEWSCGDLGIHRTTQKQGAYGGWEVFRVWYDRKGHPRKIVLTYDADTGRLTLNGKRCREVKD